MGIQDILNSLMTERRHIDVMHLPSQGLFYPEDLRLSIRRADYLEILDYETNIDRSNVIRSIECIKTVVERCASVSPPYDYSHIKSVDIIFIFLEVVKFTTGRPILVRYRDPETGAAGTAAFGPDTFNYFDFSPFMKGYSQSAREIEMHGYRFSFPSIGVENSLSRYITGLGDPTVLREVGFDFIFFQSGRHSLEDREIENLIQIFNHDLDEGERAKVSSVIASFAGITSYSLRVGGTKVEMKSNVDLETIWQD